MLRIFALVGTVLFAANFAFGLGYEKGLFHGKDIGIANAVTSSIAGSESIIFNPAGLSRTDSKNFSFSFSPTIVTFEAPIGTSNTNEKAESVVFPFSLTYSQKINEKWSYGLGVFVAAGTGADYGEIDISTTFNTFNPRFKSELAIYEFSPGVSYQANNNWSFGASWRISLAKAEFIEGAETTGTSLLEAEITDLEDVDFTGFRFGAQYTADDEKWGIGVNVRTRVQFNTEGKAAGKLETATAVGTLINLSDDKANVKTELPTQIALAGHWHANKVWSLYADLAWTNYEQIEQLEFIDITLTNANGTVSIALPSKTFEWTNTATLRLGTEWKKHKMPIRFGYVVNTPVVSEGNAIPIVEAPGYGHAFLLGSKYAFSESLTLNFALEYAVISAEVDQAAGTSLAGDYKTYAIGTHFALDWKF